MRTVILIPARHASSRFPGKPLALLLGKPMILWVAELSAQAIGKENVFVATDSAEIAERVTAAGFNSVMTSSDALTGTDRLAEAAESIDADIYVNVQGDEPTLNPDDILQIAREKQARMNAIINGFCWLGKSENPDSKNIPKVITTEQNKLVYMSRNPLPGYKDARNAPSRYKKQVCIYAFTREELRAFRSFGRKSSLEACEDIEILRFLEMRRDIYMVETRGGTLAVDVPEDIGPVEAELRRIHGPT